MVVVNVFVLKELWSVAVMTGLIGKYSKLLVQNLKHDKRVDHGKYRISTLQILKTGKNALNSKMVISRKLYPDIPFIIFNSTRLAQSCTFWSGVHFVQFCPFSEGGGFLNPHGIFYVFVLKYCLGHIFTHVLRMDCTSSIFV